ncbi:conserved hypothetical protein [Talaromyces stipitatus ATCC 10500]|uniref:Uncharacterized protein n=1 Tax=Talaromyces stipitatus (strain ATCC 10500 / CBS 375.48 / QM 6759 / NRRL 1006) TaxID=441959 RepID=B8MH88_TALSN|nr:uncharacterized protein TSTA_021280 [Talaromyces stipitatus ATCC 10500]EED17067.1 conserved hypothetical protein [Talaromyces stipitatus ATCC 10500]
MEGRDDIPLRELSRETSVHEPQEHEHGLFHPDQHEVPPYERDTEEELPPYEQRNTAPIRSTTLHRSFFILIPVALYATIAIYSWVTLCILSRMGDYTTNVHETKTRSYRAALTLQAVADLATIPTISFVCAWAACIFVQNQRDAYSLRLRQVVTLADRAWMNPAMYFRLLFYPSSFKRYGSSMLYLAIFIHIFGAITYPIQSLFLSTRSVSVQSTDRWGKIDLDNNYLRVPSISQLMRGYDFTDWSSIFTVRHLAQSAGVNGYQDNLWGNTSQLSGYGSNSSWYAPLSHNFSTGLRSDQYIPRINSSAEVLEMAAEEFPSNCSSPSSFYASYIYPNSSSPWQSTSSRQNFSEVIYVNTTANFTDPSDPNRVKPFKIIMNTTAGLFELPSVQNNLIAGPLNTNSSLCSSVTSCNGWKVRRQPLDSSALPGPLAMIALALFGPGSFADTQQTAPSSESFYSNESESQRYHDMFAADDILPLTPLGFTTSVLGEIPIDGWMSAFSSNKEDASVAFTRASFLAVKAMFDNTVRFGGDITVAFASSDLQQITLPSLPFSAMIACSVLFGLYMVPLLCLALYAAFSSSWTNTLDAFTMLRMGAAFGQQDLPLLIGKSKRKIRVLDTLPGIVRDISGPDDKVRQLALGIEGGGPLQPSKRYLAYPGNDDWMGPR